jgi:hypothetical protein
MTANPKRFPRKRNKDGSYDTISPTGFAAVEDTRIHICDSAFLAERGILTQTEPGKVPSPPSYDRTSEAA